VPGGERRALGERKKGWVQKTAKGWGRSGGKRRSPKKDLVSALVLLLSSGKGLKMDPRRKGEENDAGAVTHERRSLFYGRPGFHRENGGKSSQRKKRGRRLEGGTANRSRARSLDRKSRVHGVNIPISSTVERGDSTKMYCAGSSKAGPKPRNYKKAFIKRIMENMKEVTQTKKKTHWRGRCTPPPAGPELKFV